MFGNKKRREEQVKKLRVEKLQKTISGSGGGRSGNKRRSDAKKELNRMGHLTDKQKSQKDKKDRIAYDREHKIHDSRGRHKGYKKGYDPSKGVTGSGSSSTSSSTSKSKATMTGRERAQQMAKDRIAAKKAGTYKKPKTAQELAKERLAKKNKKK